MSINLISRRLCSSLRLATQRGVVSSSPYVSSVKRSITTTKTIATPITTKTQPIILQLPTPQLYSNNNNNTPQQIRTFSISIDTHQDNNNNDDGGPIPASIVDFDKLSNKALQDMTTIPGWNLVHNSPRRNPRGALVGKVVSDKMQKTVNVAVDRYKLIPKYRKRWRYTKKFMAHDEHEVCNEGDMVMIVPCQKISRHKHFMVREIVRQKGQL